MNSGLIKLIAELKEQFGRDLVKARKDHDLQQIKKLYLKDKMKDLYAALKAVVDLGEKKTLGQEINNLRDFMESALADVKITEIKTTEFFDPSIVKQQSKRGRLHPLMAFLNQAVTIFRSMGFSIASGPEIETDENNFTKLNMPEHHPARDMQDTFYLAGTNKLLRSHTSSVQIRAMQAGKPPFFLISPGAVFRVDDIDAQHTPMFFQLEGLVVDENIAFSDLKGTLIAFLTAMFGADLKIKFRPTFYPYTEPSAAVDINCIVCRGAGCRTCKQSGWITILGSGMVHPNVLTSVNIDPQVYSGFAFGMGIERLAMIYYGLAGIDCFYENNVAWWEQL